MKVLSFPLTLIAASIISTTAFAVPDETKMFGAAASVTIENIPTSRLKDQLDKLPAPAQARALQWLNSFSFPANDIAFLNVDNRGGVFYQDTVLPEEISQADLEADPTLEGINPTDAFKLHSKPGAPNTVYVNFKGYTITGTAWNSGAESTYQARPFNKDSDSSTFSIAERFDIGEVWHRIAEDLAPFDIDVTTEAPASFGPNVGHILVTSDTDATGKLMPHSTAGGVAYVGVWGRSNYEYYQPALVYYDNLGGGHAPYVAEASSHELGHNLALSHDGSSTVTYYTGHGTGLTSWAPVMGVGYYNNVTQWSKGEYSGANNTQDDISIIGNYLQISIDDHSNNQVAASPLTVDADGFIASSNPEFDPLNSRPDNKGTIETRTDTDVFYFDTASGDINLVINPAWDAYTRSVRRGSNLDLQAMVVDNAGNIIAISDPLNETNAVISANVTAGRYFLEITGVGNATVDGNYSDYGSLGQYYIMGTVASISDDTTPPNPDPMLWAVEPYAVSKSSISMTATDAIDDSGFVEYQFVCTSGGLGCISSTWQTDPSYVVTGLDSDTAYNYHVKARDNSANETEFSLSATAITLTNTVPLSFNDIVEGNENATTSIDVLANDSDDDGDTLQISSTTTPTHGDVVISTNTILYSPDSNYFGDDSFNYTISDGFGGTSTSSVTITVIEVNDAPIAVADSAEVLLNGSVIIDVLANDSDPESSLLSVTSATNGAKGTTAINSDGTITYTALNKKRGGDSFSYTVSDGELSATTTVTISIVKSLSGDGGGDAGGGGGKCHPKRGC